MLHVACCRLQVAGCREEYFKLVKILNGSLLFFDSALLKIHRLMFIFAFRLICSNIKIYIEHSVFPCNLQPLKSLYQTEGSPV